MSAVVKPPTAAELRGNPAEVALVLARIAAAMRQCAACGRADQRARLAPCSHADCVRDRRIYCYRCRAHVQHADR